MLLDRETELDLAACALRRAQAGRGATVLISGPLGIGKSALLDGIGELGSTMGTLTLRASAAPMERDFAFGVVRQLLESALRRAPRETAQRWMAGSAEHAQPVLADESLGVDPQPVTADEAVLHGLFTVVENMSRDQPLLVLVDDLHWADTESLRWLRHLVKRLQPMRIVLVCTLREGDLLGEQQPVREVAVHATHNLFPGAFDLEATRTLIGSHCAEQPDHEFAVACQHASGGNPAFLAAILEELGVRGLPPSAENAETAATLRPSLLRQRLLLCLESQPEQVRRAARSIAVLGDDAHPEILSRLAGLDGVGRDEALAVLSGLGLLTDRNRPRFVHPVVQEAVEEGMPLSQRTAMHAHAAELLYREGRPAEQVADQLMAITTPQGNWATQVLRAAADNALRRGEPEVAARYLRRALLDSSPDGTERARLLVDLATAERSFAPSASVRHISQAVPLLDSPRERAAAVVRLAPTVLGSTLLPVDELLRGVADQLGSEDGLRGQDRELALRLEARMRHTAAWDPAELADSVARLRGLGPDPGTNTGAERELLAVLLNAAAVANRVSASEVAQLGNRILEREPATPAHVHTTLPLAVTALVAADSVHDLVPWLNMAQQHAARRQASVEQALIRTEQALVSLACGQLADARGQALEAFELADADYHEVITVSAIALASVALQSRDGQLAEGLFEGHYRAAEEPYLWSLLTMLKGMVAAQEADPRTALDHFLDAGHRLEQSDWRNPVLLPWASCAAIMQQRLGDAGRAAELSLQEVERARAWGAPSALGRALTVHGRVTEGPPGVALLREAVELLETSADRFELCKSLLWLGERLGVSCREGESALRRAAALAVECAAPWLAERAGALLGEAAPSPAPSRQLTPSERKVAQLAASGLTNQAIADELGITSRAVEKHLTSCYRKMSIKGRAVLAAALRELDELPDTASADAQFR